MPLQGRRPAHLSRRHGALALSPRTPTPADFEICFGKIPWPCSSPMDRVSDLVQQAHHTAPTTTSPSASPASASTARWPGWRRSATMAASIGSLTREGPRRRFGGFRHRVPDAQVRSPDPAGRTSPRLGQPAGLCHIRENARARHLRHHNSPALSAECLPSPADGRMRGRGRQPVLRSPNLRPWQRRRHGDNRINAPSRALGPAGPGEGHRLLSGCTGTHGYRRGLPGHGRRRGWRQARPSSLS